MAGEYIDKVEVGAKIQMMYIRREMDYGGENDFCRGMRKALRIIENMPTADVQPVNQWISIDERLPQDGEEALVYAGNRGVMIGLYDSVLQVWLDYECCGLKVTHWQPLPKPPKDGDK